MSRAMITDTGHAELLRGRLTDAGQEEGRVH